jgi:hypothetical protein
MRRIIVFANVFAALIVVSYVYGQLDRTFLYVASNLISPTAALAPAMFCLYLISRYGLSRENSFGKVWLLMAAGLILWLIGEIAWTIGALVLTINLQFPSVADAFWLAGYLPIILALITYIKTFKVRLSEKQLSVGLGVAWVAAGLLYSFLIIPVMQSQAGVLARFFDFAYPTLDVLLLALCIIGAFIYLEGQGSRFWIWFNIGFLLVSIADVLFSYATAQGVYYDGHPLELLFHFGYLAVLLGLNEQRCTL